MKNVIINAYGKSNRGDAVLLSECISGILQHDESGEIVVALFESENSQTESENEIVFTERLGNSHRFIFLPRVRSCLIILACYIYVGVKIPLTAIRFLLPKDQWKTLIKLRLCDVVVSAPGGYLHDANFAYYIALANIHFGVILKKTVILAPQSIGPIRSKLGRWYASYVLRRVKFICVREDFSEGFVVNSLGVPPASVLRTGDCAFWNDDVAREDQASRILKGLGIDEGDLVFGMTVVNWKFSETPNPQLAIRTFVDQMVLIAEAMAKRGLKVVIFNQVREDLPVASLLKTKASCSVVVDTVCHEPDVLRALIRRSTVFLGSRFHSCIFALLAGRPTFAIGYLPKTFYLMSDLNLISRQCGINEIDVTAVIKALGRDLERLVEAEDEISYAVRRYREKFADFGRVVGAIYASKVT